MFKPSRSVRTGDQTQLRKSQSTEYILEGTELLARAICHECEHLDGIMFVSHVEGELVDASQLFDEDEEEIEE